MKIKTSLCAGAALGVFAIAGAAAAQDTTTAWKGAPQWTNDDVQFKVRGRVLLDTVFEDVDRETGATRISASSAAARCSWASRASSTTTSPTRSKAAG